ncbi:MAG: Stp1/IreP family PP2C-type Ser/Thr phosphatase [Labilithrix sp.]|nr:Stp1/IreP family PP2C-type Ser/Thr phosphatase [Labilithrix sp.]MCW5817489.1 Stp1/IreP family PP2C-type Ser/Thr phosphatase [Labilithrix sp.]
MTSVADPPPATPNEDAAKAAQVESESSMPVAQAASADGVRIQLFARTDVGQVREHNEDNFLVADLTKRSRGLLEANRATAIGQQGAIFAVCDGMGGAAAGEIASQLAVDIIYERLVDGLGDRPVKRDELARRLVRAIESAGLRIFQEAKADRSRRGMGTTVTAAALVDEILFFAQVGDSRGYILRGDTLVQLTRDQSLVNQLIEAGQLTEEEAETFEHNNIILQALGTSDTVQVDLTFAEIRKGDILLLCSDGLSGMVRFEDIRESLRSGMEPLDICKQLTERANAAGGHDNITVIIVNFDGPNLKERDAEGEPLKYRKYVLPDESMEERATAPAGSAGAPGGASSEGAQRAASNPPATWQEKGAHADHDYDRVDIPGTHVPIWMVVSIIAGVVVLLAGTAFLLLR